MPRVEIAEDFFVAMVGVNFVVGELVVVSNKVLVI